MNSTSIFLLLLLIALFAAPGFTQPESFVIAKKGKASAAIVVSDTSISAEMTAANELAKYLTKISSADFPVYEIGKEPVNLPKIYIGQSATTKKLLKNIDWNTLKYDGIVIKFVDKDLVLVGDRPRGTLYAVYTFLEEYLGCRWWTAQRSYIPSNPNLEVKKEDKTHLPPFMYREAYFPEVKYKNPEFCVQLKLNGTHHPTPQNFGGSYNLLGFVHTFETFVPAEKHMSEHPEWFSLIKGERVGGQTTGQLCLSNSEVVDIVAEQALLLIQKNEAAGMISVSQNDNPFYCQCENCNALAEKYGGQSGILIHFVNQVADKIAEKYPNFLVETLAYHYSRHAPKNIVPRENVIVRLCTAECDFTFPLTAPSNKEFFDDITGWKNICKRLYIWNYVANFVDLTLGHPNWHVLAPNIRFFAENNVIGQFEQGDAFNKDAGFGQMKLWVISHLLWDPKLNTEDLMREYANANYGAAAPYLLDFIELTCDAIQKSGLRLTYRFGSNLEYMDQAEMDQATRLFDKAEQAVENQPEILSRVREARLALDHMWLLQPQLDITNAGKARGLDMIGIAENFINLSQSSGNDYIGEGSKMNDAYYKYLIDYASIPPVADSLANIPAPEAAKDLKSDEWIDMQENKISVVNPGVLAVIVGDENASNKRAIRMPGKNLDWAVQAFLERAKLNPGTEVDVYVTVKVKLNAESGAAFTAGIYDNVNSVKPVFYNYKIEDIGDSEYHDYKLGTFTPKEGWFVYVAPPGDGNQVEEVLVDRVFLIIKK